MKLDGYTRLAAVVANPIKHSISPFIHNRAFEATATNGAYVAWEIEAGDLAETVANIRRYQMFGINLSMPYKEQVIPYLDGLSDEARLIGAVNTVVNENGNLIGYNTDGKGFFKSLPSFTITGKKMTLLGQVVRPSPFWHKLFWTASVRFQSLFVQFPWKKQDLT